MEPLAQTICTDPHITGIKVRDTTHKIGLYADNVIISLTDLANSLPQLQRVLVSFSTISHYKNNYSKSSMLDICLHLSVKRRIASLSPFSWAPNSTLQYLGIQLVSPSSQLLRLDLNALHSKLQCISQSLQTNHAS